MVGCSRTHTGPDSSGCAAAGGQLNAAPASTKTFNPSLTAGIGNFSFSKVGIKESILSDNWSLLMAPMTHWPLFWNSVFEVRMLLKIKICASLFRAEERGVDAGLWYLECWYLECC